MKTIICAITLFACATPRLSAGTVTYAFSGAVFLENFPGTPNELGPIVSGATFTGSFTVELDATGAPSGTPGFTDYGQPVPPAEFSLTVGSLTIQSNTTGSTMDALIGLGLAGIVDNFTLSVSQASVAGPDWAYSPDPAGRTIATNFSLKFPAGFLTDLAHLPVLSPLDFAKPANASVLFGAGTYTFPGGSINLEPGTEAEMNLGLTSLTLVPEPSPFLLAAIAGPLVWFSRGKRSRLI